VEIQRHLERDKMKVFLLKGLCHQLVKVGSLDRALVGASYLQNVNLTVPFIYHRLLKFLPSLYRIHSNAPLSTYHERR
jgi:hypothetical protein